MNGADWLAQIIAAPDDDALRAVYADWLIERGDPLGELIHTQLRMATAPTDVLAALERRLLAVHARRIVRPFVDLGASNIKLRRGLVERLTIDAAALQVNATQLFAMAPIRALAIEGSPTPALAHVPELARVVDLTFVALDGPTSAALVRAPQLAHLKALAVLGGLGFFAGIAALANLRGLALARQPVRPFIREVAALPLLERLELPRCNLDAAAVQQLCDEREHGLVELVLAENPIGDAGAHALAATDNLPHLVELDVRNCQLTRAGARALARTRIERIHGLANRSRLR